MNTYNTRTPHSYINTCIFVLKMFFKIWCCIELKIKSIKIKGTFIKDCFFLLLFSLTSLTDFNTFNRYQYTRDKVCANIWYSSFIWQSDACYTVYLHMAMHFTLLSPILIPITITFVCLKFDWSRSLTEIVFITLKWIRLKSC